MPASRRTESAPSRSRLAQALFSPTAVALIGASSDITQLASRPERVLKFHGYPGAIVKVPAAAAETARSEHSLNRALREFSGRIDHAYIMTPATSVAAAVAECAAAGVQVATILSAGFAERGPSGKRRQEALLAARRGTGLRLLGPNSLGVVNVQAKFALSANAVLENEPLRAGHVSLVSQSGSMLGAILTRAQERGIGFSKLVALGNECDIALGEVLQLLVDDPDTQAILLFMEAFRDADVLAQAARRAFEAGKPVIALKLGRSSLGREVAVSHTGALIGDDAAAEAFFREHGILRVSVLDALFETVPLVLGHRPPSARRVGVLTVSGGGAAMVIDRLGDSAISLAPPPPAMIRQLAARRIRISDAPMIDLPMGRADRGAYAAILDSLLASDHCDLVLSVLGSNATHLPATVPQRILAASRGNKPLAVFAAPRAAEALQLLQANGIAAFRTPESCAEAMRAYCDWSAPSLSTPIDAGDAACVAECVRRIARLGPSDEAAALELMQALGIPVAPFVVLKSCEDAAHLDFPVAAKIVSPGLAHKSEIGGVALDIATPEALRLRATEMVERVRASHPRLRIDGVLVQSMARGIAEVIVGFRRDPDVGPIVMVGMGGVLAELWPHRAVRLAPVSTEAARRMIASVPALAAIRGYRNQPPGDLEGLARALHRISLLAVPDSPLVLEAEINPLVVRQQGVLAVDALVRLDVRAI